MMEGSCEESVTLELGTRLSSGRTVTVPEPSASDIDFTFNTDMQRTGDFNVNLNMKNTSTESRLVDVHVSALSCKYTGIPNADIKDTCTATVLEPNAQSEVLLSIKCADYIGVVDADSHVNIYALAIVKETGQRFIACEAIWIEKPHIELKTEGSAHVGKTFDVLIKLVNPLAVPMTNGHIHIEGPGMQRISSLKVKKSIAPGEEVRETVQMKPRRLGRKEIIASFHSKQVCDVTGVTEVDVTDENRS